MLRGRLLAQLDIENKDSRRWTCFILKGKICFEITINESCVILSGGQALRRVLGREQARNTPGEGKRRKAKINYF